MKKILNITASAKGANSFSNQLSDAIVEELQKQNPDSTLKTIDLGKNALPHLDETLLTAFFTPEDVHTETDKIAIKNSNDAIADILESDIIVLGVPLYNFGIPSTIKSWVDHICRAGVTFAYTENGPKGLVENKKVYLAIASGGIYSEGPMKAYDFTESYLKAVLGFLGMTDVTVFRVEGTAMPELKDIAVTKALETVTEFAF